MKKVRLTPAKLMALYFLISIFIGTFLLMLPFSTTSSSISFIDALFTATSAMCVTGLTVVDTGTCFSHFGQIIILSLIELGGIGITVYATFFMLLLKGRISLKEHLILKDTMTIEGEINLVKVLKHIFAFTVLFELVGLILLSIYFSKKYPLPEAMYISLFHSISAFCNAGFSIFSDSLIQFKNNIFVIGVISLLIIGGGLGFIVHEEILEKILGKSNRLSWSLHFKIVVSITLFLLILGSALLYIFEKGEIGILGAVFQSVTARTAGFNTVNISELTSASLFFIIFLMFIGGAPGSTAGGIKVTTFFIIFKFFVDRLKNKPHLSIWNRNIPHDVIVKSLMVFIASIFFIFTATLLLVAIEPNQIHKNFLSLLFETVSAFGTVGLSTGITPHLSNIGKLILIITMFAGRIGPLTFVFALSLKEEEKVLFEYPEENVMIG